MMVSYSFHEVTVVRKGFIFKKIALLILISFSTTYSVDKKKQDNNDISKEKTDNNSNVFSNNQRDEIKNVVIKTLMENPDIIIAAVQGLEIKRRNSMIQADEALIKTNFDDIFQNGMIIGDKNSKTKFILFTDPLCPHCQKFGEFLGNDFKKLSDVGISLYPVSIMSEDSKPLSKFIRASYFQGHEKAVLFLKNLSAFLETNKEKLDPKVILEIAKKSGLDEKKLEKDQRSDELNKIVDGGTDLHQKLSFQAVPIMFGKHSDKNISMIPVPTKIDDFNKVAKNMLITKKEAIEKEEKDQENSSKETIEVTTEQTN